MADQNPFDDLIPKSGNAGAFDDLIPKSTTGQRIADVGLSVARGVVGLGESAVGIADIATGGGFGNALERAGFNPKATKQAINEYMSPAGQADAQAVSEAKGILPTAGEVLSRPWYLANVVGESAPSMIGALGVGRGLQAVAPKLSGAVAGALGEGAVTAGSTAEQIRQDTGTLDGQGTLASLGAGVTTAATGALGNFAARALKVASPDTVGLLNRGLDKVSGNIVGRMAKGMGVEAGEEFFQSGTEQAWQNVGTGKPLMENVPEQATIGGLAGGVMGGLFGMQPRREEKREEPNDPGAVAPPGPLQAAAEVGKINGAVQGGPADPGAPSGLGGVRGLIADAASRAGVDPKTALTIAAIETGGRFNADAANPKSSARGVFQFMDATRKMFPEVTPEQWQDPKVQAEYGAKFIAQTNASMAKYLGRQPSTSEAYMGHLLGAFGAAKVLTADPALPVRDVIAQYDPKRADEIVRLNGMKDMSAGDAVAKWQSVAQRAQDRLGVEESAFPFTDQKAAQMRVAAAAREGQALEVVEHPTVPGRFAALPPQEGNPNEKQADNGVPLVADLPRYDTDPNEPQAPQAVQGQAQGQEASAVDAGLSAAQPGAQAAAQSAEPGAAAPAPVDDAEQAALREELRQELIAQRGLTPGVDYNHQPSAAQANAGNYKMVHESWSGLPLTIENPVGSTRVSKDPANPWETTMEADYGYIKRTVAADTTGNGKADRIDFYKPMDAEPSAPVFVIDQINQDGTFDEHKAILGVNSREEAELLYDQHFSDGTGPTRRAAVSEMSMSEFKRWLKSGTTQNTPASVAQPTLREQQAVADGVIPESVQPDASGLFSGVPEAAKWAADNGLDAKPVLTEQGVTLAPNLTNQWSRPEFAAAESPKLADLNSALSQSGTAPAEPLRSAPTEGLALASHVAEKVFGVKVVPVENHADFSGVAYKNRVYLSASEKYPTLAVAGHEVTHAFEGTPLHKQLIEVFNTYGIDPKQQVADRQASEQAADSRQITKAYARNEVIADMNGSMWVDHKFWRELAARDESLFRRVAYKFMELTTKAIQTVKGSRFDSQAIVKDVAAARAAIAQAWADHLKEGTKAKSKSAPVYQQSKNGPVSREEYDRNLAEFLAPSVEKGDFYHGTAQDITAFRAKQAGATFVTKNPRFAQDFADASEVWMKDNFDTLLDKGQFEQARRDAVKSVRDHYGTRKQGKTLIDELNQPVDFDKKFPGGDREVSEALIWSKELSGEAQDFLRTALADQMPSRANVMKLKVRATNPFDFAKPEHMEAINRYEKEKRYTKDSISNHVGYIRMGDWSSIESRVVQKAIKAMGHDGFYVKENGVKNLAVYNPGQVKSATGNRGTFDPTKADLRYARNSGSKTERELPEHVARYLTESEKAKLRADSASKIVELFDSLPPSIDETAAVAWAGRDKRGWYAQSAKALMHVFGPDAPRFAALLAAMSPQTSVQSNLTNAVNTWANWVQAGRPSKPERIVQIMGRSVQGNNLTDSVLPAWIPNSIRALTSDNPESVTISGPKVNSFMLNLRGDVAEVTNDAWMAAYAGVSQKLFAGKLNVAETNPGKAPGYLAMSAHVRAAAERLSELTGETWTPVEVQETVWSWSKTLYEMQEAREGGYGAVEILNNEELTGDLIAATPDFSTLLKDKSYAQALEQAGYTSRLRTLRSGRGDGAAGGQVARAGRQAAPFAGKDQGDFERTAARRLEDLRDSRARSRAEEVTGGPAFSRNEPEDVRAKPGANIKRLAGLLGPQLYGDMSKMGTVTVKELFQNSFDALKGAIAKGQFDEDTLPKIDIETDSNTRIIRVTDNGSGMTPEIINKAFLSIAGTHKETERGSGGFGVAKMLFLYGNEKLSLRTVRDGVESTLETSGSQLMEAFDNPDSAPMIQTRRVDEPNGTMVEITVPQTWRNPSTGSEESIEFPYSYQVKDILNKSPLFEDIVVAYDGMTMPIGGHFNKNDYTTFSTVKFDWGTARIIVAKKEMSHTPYRNLHVLSNGLWQFSSTLKENPFDSGSDAIPRDFYINLEPRVKPEEPGYPFALNRQGFSPTAIDDFKKIINYLSVLYTGSKAAQTASGFGTIEYVNEDGTVSDQMDLAPPPVARDGKTTLAISEGDAIEIKDGRMVVNGREVPELTPAELSAVKVDMSKFKVDQGSVDSTRPMVHDNLEITTSGGRSMSQFMRDWKGKSFDQYVHGVGSVFMELRNALAEELKEYRTIMDVPVGVSFDTEYYGVHIRVPFNGMFVNPGLTQLDDDGGQHNMRRVANAMIGTMLHEATHYRHGNHDASFASGMQRVFAALESSETFDLGAARSKLAAILEEHRDVYEAINTLYRKDGIVQNRGAKLQDGADYDRRNGPAGDAAGQRGAGRDGGLGRPDWAGVGDGPQGQDAQGVRADAGEPGAVGPRFARNRDQRASIGLSASTSSIEGLKQLTEAANAGDKQAASLLHSIGEDSLRTLLRGTGARLKAQRDTGLFEGYAEPSLGLTVQFEERHRPQVLAALAKFADNFNQKQVHLRQSTTAPVGTDFGDGSFATVVYRFNLPKPLTREQVQKVIDEAGLYGLTFGPTHVEAYYVGEPNDEDAIHQFEQGIQRARASLGGRAAAPEQSAQRLWVYGEGGIGYEAIRGVLPAAPSGQVRTARRVAERLAGGPVQGSRQAPEITPSQRARQERIARAFERLPDNDLDNPLVARAYRELAQEVIAQYKALPIKVEMYGERAEPYPNSDAMRADLLLNNHLFVYATEADNFGPAGEDFSSHPLLQDSGLKDVNDRPMVFNDLLRAVHDYYAHAITPTQFGPRGEEAAWRNHMEMTRSPWARWALTSETRGQNSWVNFREGVQAIPTKDRPFARQKAALLPLRDALTGSRRIDVPMVRLMSELSPAQRQGSLPQPRFARNLTGVELPPDAKFAVDPGPGRSMRYFAERAEAEAFAKQAYEGEDYTPFIREIGARQRPMFYSALHRELEKSVNAKALPVIGWKQAINSLLNKGAIRRDEIEWSGINEWLDMQQGKVTKLGREEVMGYLRENGVGLQEEVFNSPSEETKKSWIERRAEELRDEKESEWESLRDGFEDRFQPRFYVQQESAQDGEEPKWAIYGDRYNSTGELYDTEEEAQDAAFDMDEEEREAYMNEALDDFYDGFDAEEQAAEEWAENSEQYDQTRFLDYSLPRGENYREVLLMLPSMPDSPQGLALREAVFAKYQPMIDELYKRMENPETTPTQGRALLVDLEALQKRRDREADKAYKLKDDQRKFKSSHWEQDNVLAHVRVKDRNLDGHSSWDTGARMLFVEEIQSDWAQIGRKEGFIQPASAEDQARAQELHKDLVKAESRLAAAEQVVNELAAPRTAARVAMEEAQQRAVDMTLDRGLPADVRHYTRLALEAKQRYEALVQDNEDVYADARSERSSAYNEVERLRTQIYRLEQPKGEAPVAPFVEVTDKWVELALKRIIRMAVDGGYDGVAFATGEQNADRYNQQEEISRIDYKANHSDPDAIRTATDMGLKPAEAWHVRVLGRTGGEILNEVMDRKELGRMLGTSISERVMADQGQKLAGAQDGFKSLQGEGLKMGGQGMIAFYDKIIPSLLAKMLPKLGGDKQLKVGSISYPEGTRNYSSGPFRSHQHQYFEITPKMRESVAGGFPLFMRNPAMSNPLKDVTVKSVKEQVKGKWTDLRSLALTALGGRQLAEVYAKDLPALPQYQHLVQMMQAGISDIVAEADSIAVRWGKLKDEKALAELMHDATLARVDPAKPYKPGDPESHYRELTARYKALSPEAQAMFVQARDAYENHYNEVKKAIRERIERADVSAPKKSQMLQRMDEQFFGAVQGIYFPLARFGQYIVVVRDAEGKSANVSRAETKAEADALRRELRAQYGLGYTVSHVIKQADFNARRDMVGNEFLESLYKVLDETGIGEDLQDEINQLVLSSMPEMSWAKHGIHRKGTPGFSQDARRAFAHHMVHGARYLQRVRYGDRMEAKLREMEK